MVKHPKPVAALYGGSFDPPHKGHEAIVKHALEALPVEAVIVEPTWRNPFKSGVHASPEKRYEWLTRIFASHPNVIVDDYEIRQGRSVRTYETLQHLRKRYDVRYLVVGADNLDTLPQWHRFDELNRSVTWVIATRPGYNADTSHLREAIVLETDLPVSSTEIRDEGVFTYVNEHIRNEVKARYTSKGDL